MPERRAFQRSLLRWYARHKRDLLWRKDRDPYQVMVSEFMLQQTRVETVLPYFERFLKTFPTLEALAKASLQSVLKAWAGLGYYARARYLHAAAKTVCNDLGGKIPSSKKDFLSLPGFGPYIAGAVASIAFNEPAAAFLTVRGSARKKWWRDSLGMMEMFDLETKNRGRRQERISPFRERRCRPCIAARKSFPLNSPGLKGEKSGYDFTGTA